MISTINRFLGVLYNNRKINPPEPITNLGKLSPEGCLNVMNPQKRVLLSYITMPFRLSENDPSLKRFSNIGIARCIVQALNDLGYLVDIIEWSDNKFIPSKYYDLFIGHGGINYERICRKLSPNTTKIYFSTGLYWQTHNQNELKRFHDLEKRRGAKLYPDRLIKASEEWANNNADAIICLGNENTRKSYAKFKNVIYINNGSYLDDHYDIISHNFEVKRKNFLFFSGSGNVHKGLDLLLETFPGLDADLWICQEIDRRFHKIYRHELEDYPNIHNIGWVTLRSSKFYEIVDKCGYIIFPSCSEGQAGSVIECMNQGLIPIVSKKTGIDIEGFGIQLDTCTIQEILTCINNLSEKSSDWLKEMSLKTRKITVKNYSPDFFIENFKRSIETVINVES